VSRSPLAPVLAVAALAGLARALTVAGLELYHDEAYYWLWSLRPAWGYFDHPPMVAWLVALSTALVPGELGVRLPFFVCSALAVLFAGLTARELSADRRAPLYGALLAAGSPMLHLTGMLALPDGPLEAAYAAAVWLIARARGRGWAWAGVAVGLALLSKYSAALLAPSLLLLVAWDPSLRRELRTPWPWIGAAIAVAIFAPTLAWDAGRDFESIRYQLRHGFRDRPLLRYFRNYVLAQLGGAPVALVCGTIAVARPASEAWRRVAAATLVPLAVTLYSAVKGPAEVNWAAHVLPSLAGAAGAWLAGRRAARPLVLGSVAATALAALAFGVVQHSDRWAGTTAHRRFHGWKELAAGLRAGAAEACAAAGASCDLADPFVFPPNYRYAGHLAFYTGWRRLGPAIGRGSQLDLWDLAPRPGEPVLVVVDSPETLADFEARARASRAAPERWVEIRMHGRRVARAGVALYRDFADPQFAR
jgi:4-amino-4-deoxy-L-arabinose transferase-like glycosyltransferase